MRSALQGLERSAILGPSCWPLSVSLFLQETQRPMDASPSTILATIALVLIVVVTGGISYLTACEWRDRRRQKRDDLGRR